MAANDPATRVAIAQSGAAARWSPDARTASAIRTLVDAAPELTPEQLDALRPVFARITAQGGR